MRNRLDSLPGFFSASSSGACRWVTDRRHHERSDVEAPVSFSWKGLEGVRQHQGEGTVRNLSRGDVFISTGDPPAVGANVSFRVFFRSLLPGSRLVMQADAGVVRAELSPQPEAPAGFAVALKSYVLHNENEMIERVKRGP